jgi:hypothetical protein
VKLWHGSARPLPVAVRPVVGETHPSYSRRLAAANDLTPYAVLRALGDPRTTVGKHLLICDARINEHAAARLEAYTGIPRERLARALPAMTRQAHPGDTLPTDQPALCFVRAHPRQPCRKCELAATGAAGLAVLVLPGWTPLVCQRHRRWAGPADDTSQHDLSAAPDVLAASRRRARLLARSGDRRWAWQEFRTAWHIARDWPGRSLQRMPAVAQRWHERAAALGTSTFTDTPKGKQTSWIVAFPEATAITEILTDLNLRRRIALEYNDSPLYQRISASIGEQRYQEWAYSNAPIRRWVDGHRSKFEQVRSVFWRGPIPPPEHFK